MSARHHHTGLLALALLLTVGAAASATAVAPIDDGSRAGRGLKQSDPTDCVVPPGYTFVQGLDSYGNDIGNCYDAGCTANFTTLAAVCDADDSCVGINTLGWYKYALSSRNNWAWLSSDACEGTLVKQVTGACENIPTGYTFVQGLDSYGGDIGNCAETGCTASLAELTAACDAKPGCIAVNTIGWLKFNVQAQDDWDRLWNDPCAGTLLKGLEAPVCTDIPANYTYFQGLDSYGNDIGNCAESGCTLNFATLTAACDADPTCVAVNTIGWLKYAALPKSQWGYLSDNPCQGTLLKNTSPGTCIAPEGYTFSQGYDSWGFDTGNCADEGCTTDFTTLAAACNESSGCMGINTLGWIKYYVKPEAEWDRLWNEPCSGILVRAGGATECRIPAGYTLYQGKDSYGNDIGNCADSGCAQSLAKLAAACDADPTCVAANTNGWLKSSLLPTTYWFRFDDNPCKGLIVKEGTNLTACPPNQGTCYSSSWCTDLLSNQQHCGRCNNICPDGELCQNGECTTCADGLSLCWQTCVNQTSDRWNCGRCGGSCWRSGADFGGACENGTCVFDARACLPSKTWCGDAGCIDVTSNDANCGACGKVCDEGQICVGGTCQALDDGDNSCCVRYSNCPGETGTSCGNGCCCCAGGQKCRTEGVKDFCDVDTSPAISGDVAAASGLVLKVALNSTFTP